MRYFVKHRLNHAAHVEERVRTLVARVPNRFFRFQSCRWLALVFSDYPINNPLFVDAVPLNYGHPLSFNEALLRIYLSYRPDDKRVAFSSAPDIEVIRMALQVFGEFKADFKAIPLSFDHEAMLMLLGKRNEKFEHLLEYSFSKLDWRHPYENSGDCQGEMVAHTALLAYMIVGLNGLWSGLVSFPMDIWRASNLVKLPPPPQNAPLRLVYSQICISSLFLGKGSLSNNAHRNLWL